MQRWIRLSMVFSLISLFFSFSAIFIVQAESEAEVVANADIALRDAFLAVSSVENSGADIAFLIDKLNDAGVILTSAKVALEMGNYNDAVNRADLCTSMASSIVEAVNALKVDVLATLPRWLFPVFLSVFGSGVFIIGLFLVWRRFKWIYETKLFQRKPEAVE